MSEQLVTGPQGTPAEGREWAGLPDDDERLAALAAPFMFVRPGVPVDVNIHDHRGSLWAEPNGGSIRAHRDTVLHFASTTPFTLTFAQLGGTREPIAAVAAQGHGNRWDAYVGPLKSGALAPFYKYTITTADGLQLDPIVIVDK